MPVKNFRLHQRVGVIPVYFRNEIPHFVLVTRSSGYGWTLPKGHQEDGFAPWHQASIEAFEEAGIVGRISEDPLGVFAKESGKSVPCIPSSC